jgi:hypothetical protein
MRELLRKKQQNNIYIAVWATLTIVKYQYYC